MPPIITRQVLTARDTALYALGVGADELDFVFEERLKALPAGPACHTGAQSCFFRRLEGAELRVALPRTSIMPAIVGE